MKISGSVIALSSDVHSEQMDLSLEKNTREKISGKRSRQPGNIRDSSQILVDRVSITQNEMTEYQSNYSARVTANALVTSPASGETIEFDQQAAMEKLVGGLIDRDVVISRIQGKGDLQFSGAERAGTGLPGSQSNFVQTRIAQGWEMSLNKTDIHFETETIDFSSTGKVTTEDGREIDFSLDMSLDRAFLSRTEQEIMAQRWQERINLTDPLVISLDGRAPQLSDARFNFDLDGDGQMETINFVSPGSGFLAFDKNNDHVINNGSELFGPGTGNGFDELAAFDDDRNNWIDENDAVFSKLSVWTKDENGSDVLVSLKDAGIGAIALDYAATAFNMTQSDNQLKGRLKSSGIFLFENGNAGLVHQIDLVSHPLAETIEKPVRGGAGEETKRAPVIFAGKPSLATAADTPQAGAVSSPLQDLLDRIEDLKEEMALLLKKMESPPDRYRFRPSHHRDYMGEPPDYSSLMFGDGALIHAQGRYA